MKLTWKTCFQVGLTILLLILCVMLLPKAGNFLVTLYSAAGPLIIGAVVAYIVNLLLNVYEKWYFPKSKKKFWNKTRRPICILGAFLTLILVVGLVVALVVPQLVSCVALILDIIPDTLDDFVDLLTEKHLLGDKLLGYLNDIDWESRLNQMIQVITSGIGDVFGAVVGTVSTVFSGVVTTLLAVIFSIYLLSDKERLASQFGRIAKRYIGPKVMGKANHVLAVLNDAFKKYIVGQCTEAVILGVLCTIGMWILQLPYATMVGALIAFTALIPVAGAYIGAFVGAFMILTVSPMKALVFLIYIVILQQLEGNIIYPKVVGSSIGLPGIWVLAAVTVGGGLLGITGMMIGVPLAATAYRLLREDVNRAGEKAPLFVKKEKAAAPAPKKKPEE